MLYIASILLIPTLLFASLIELQTKQDINNIRYISKDAKLTYFQSNSGILQLSKNYKNYPILKGDRFSYYTIQVTSAKKKTLITQDSSFHKKLNILKEKRIFIANYAETKAQEIARGLNPKLQLSDSWISFYKPRKKEIQLYSLATKQLTSIPLKNRISPYFIPSVLMISSTEVLYTDLGKDGEEILSVYSRIDKKSQEIFQSQAPLFKLNFCRSEDNIILARFSHSIIHPGSQIISIPIYNNQNYKQKNILYSSALNDHPRLICKDNAVLFLKTVHYNKELNKNSRDLYRLHLKSLKLERLSKTKDLSQVLLLDGNILVSRRSKLYLADATKSSFQSDELKKVKK